MTPTTTAKVKYGVWGLLVGAVIAIIIGFAWGGWKTRGAAETRTKEALLATRSAICVARFMRQPNLAEQLQAFEDVSAWKRAEFIEQKGWDKMPGEDEAGYAVARACADGLAQVLEERKP